MLFSKAENYCQHIHQFLVTGIWNFVLNCTTEDFIMIVKNPPNQPSLDYLFEPFWIFIFFVNLATQYSKCKLNILSFIEFGWRHRDYQVRKTKFRKWTIQCVREKTLTIRKLNYTLFWYKHRAIIRITTAYTNELVRTSHDFPFTIPFKWYTYMVYPISSKL